jgi:hypothetical protein
MPEKASDGLALVNNRRIDLRQNRLIYVNARQGD